MNFKLFSYVLIVCSLGLFACRKGSTERPSVAITQISEHPALDNNRKGIVDTLVAKGYAAPSYECAHGNQALAKQIARKFISEQPKVIVAIATPSAQAFLGEPNCPPVVFSAITDPKLAGLMGKKHITGVTDLVDHKEQIAFFKQLLPELKTLGMIFNPSEINSILAVDMATQAAASLGITIKTAPANKNSEVMSAAQVLSTSCQALFVDNDNVALAAIASIVQVANQSKLPVFCSDLETLELGVSASLGPDQYALGQQVAQQVIALLEGTAPSSIPIEGPRTLRRAVNAAQIERLGLKVPKDL